MSKPLKQIPEFPSEDDERAFWGAKSRDSTEYLDCTPQPYVVKSPLN